MRGTLGIGISCAALGLAGCFFEGSSSGTRYGTLVVDWTVDGSKSPAACRQNGVDAIDVSIHTVDGAFVDEFQDNCENFATSIDLLPGAYLVDSTLLDAGGHDITTPVSDRVRIYRYESSVSAIDFPLDSFL